jgi:uncharacterized protein
VGPVVAEETPVAFDKKGVYVENKDTTIVETLNKRLELIILPTEGCNFNCTYCYEEHAKNGGMKPEVVESIRKLMSLRAPNLERLMIQWFGGEPTVRYDIMVDIMEHAQTLKANSGGRLSVSSIATTNAYLLTPDKFARLVSLGVTNYQITLDGDKEEHDKLRIRADGKGTFDVIWGNLVAMRESDLDFTVMIRLHVNKNNEESMRSLLQKIAKEFGDDKRFIVYVRALSQLGGQNDSSLPVLEDMKIVDELKKYTTSLGLRLPEIDIYREDPNYICYAAKPFAYMIRPDGSIGKCTVALRSSKNAVGRLNPDGTMELDSEKISEWSRGLFSGKKSELACPMRGLALKNDITPKLLRIERLNDDAVRQQLSRSLA